MLYDKNVELKQKPFAIGARIEHPQEAINKAQFGDTEEIDLSDKVSNIEAPRFFHVKELDNNYSNFLENSLGGFASHTEVYDVAVIFDKEKGLYAIPFYETFLSIFGICFLVSFYKQIF